MKLQCPLKPIQNLLDSGECTKRECAWWDSEKECCIMVRLCDELHNVSYDLHNIYKVV